MSEVFLCAKGQLDARSRRDLRAASVVVVEVENPERCQFIRATETISADDMLWAVLDAINVKGNYGSTGEGQRERLAMNLLRVVNDARKGKTDD